MYGNLLSTAWQLPQQTPCRGTKTDSVGGAQAFPTLESPRFHPGQESNGEGRGVCSQLVRVFQRESAPPENGAAEMSPQQSHLNYFSISIFLSNHQRLFQKLVIIHNKQTVYK